MQSKLENLEVLLVSNGHVAMLIRKIYVQLCSITGGEQRTRAYLKQELSKDE